MPVAGAPLSLTGATESRILLPLWDHRVAFPRTVFTRQSSGIRHCKMHRRRVAAGHFTLKQPWGSPTKRNGQITRAWLASAGARHRHPGSDSAPVLERQIIVGADFPRLAATFAL